jgi:predicted nuclease of predicted toxin-antitoxin system
MKFLLDENLPPALTRLFIDAGHEALHISDMGMIGVPDEWVAAFAKMHGQTIVTREDDFDTRASGTVRVLRLEVGDRGDDIVRAILTAHLQTAIAQFVQRPLVVLALTPPA